MRWRGRMYVVRQPWPGSDTLYSELFRWNCSCELQKKVTCNFHSKVQSFASYLRWANLAICDTLKNRDGQCVHQADHVSAWLSINDKLFNDKIKILFNKFIGALEIYYYNYYYFLFCYSSPSNYYYFPWCCVVRDDASLQLLPALGPAQPNKIRCLALLQ